MIVNFYDEKNAENSIHGAILQIKKEHQTWFFQILGIIIVLTTILILFTYLFSNFIGKIFNKYNSELEDKTVSLEHWKKRFELAIIASNDVRAIFLNVGTLK